MEKIIKFKGLDIDATKIVAIGAITSHKDDVKKKSWYQFSIYIHGISTGIHLESLAKPALDEDRKVILKLWKESTGDAVHHTHTKQLCVGFAEWQKQEERNGNIEWLQGENTWAVFESAPYFHFSNIWITTSDLYEHYLKYLKEKENGK